MTLSSASPIVPIRRARADFRVGAVEDLLARVESLLTSAKLDANVAGTDPVESLTARSYQDLSGQIIRGVITLVGEVESTLGQLALLAGHDPANLEKTDAAASSPM